jgi:hypothetical protein
VSDESPFQHAPDATCPCIVCGYHRARGAANDGAPVDLDEQVEDITPPALAKLRDAPGGSGRCTSTINAPHLTREERRVGRLLVAPPDVERPRTRSDCQDGPRPCPWVSCSWHLYLEVTEAGSIKLAHPHLDPWELDETCALDVADRGGETLERLGELLGVTRERIRQLEVAALQKMRFVYPERAA